MNAHPAQPPLQGPPHRCWAEVDLGALERNIGKVRAALPQGVRYVAVVKADAYGHGALPTVTRLMQSGVEAFAVANAGEGASIREVGVGWPILILGPTLPFEDGAVLANDLTVTLSTLEEARRFDALGQSAGQRIRCHLKVDTGMGRMGVWHEAAGPMIEALASLPHLDVEGIYTHFSSADTDPAFTEEQRRRFRAVVAQVRRWHQGPLVIHADNSAGLHGFDAVNGFNAVRIGLLQFGHQPGPGSLLAGLAPEPVLSFRARVGLVKALPAGAPISYGQTHRLARDSRVAVLTVGYGDGLPTAASNRGQGLIRGQACPILGRVTMDQTMVDASEVPGVTPGDVATLIGRDGAASIDVTAFAKDSWSVPWEALCAISKRVRRVYQQPRFG